MDESTIPNASDEPSGDDLLRKLALALLAPRFAHSEPTVEPQLLVGQLPPNLAFGIPLPEGARVLGSLLGGEPTIAIESPLAPEETAEFYRAALAVEGWSEAAGPGFGRGGFVPSTSDHTTVIVLDRGEEGPSLQFMCYEARDGGASVQISITAHVPMPPHLRARHMMRQHSMSQVLPAIKPPPHTNQQMRGSNSGPDHVDSRATLETDLDVPAVGAHYRTQLERAGWQLSGSGESGPVAWSTWTFNDDEGQPWAATFAAVRQANAPRRYDLWIGANYAGASPANPGGRRVVSGIATSITSEGPLG